jgi:hypothetical protein
VSQRVTAAIRLAATPSAQKISSMPAKTIKVVHFQLGHIASSSLRCNIAPQRNRGLG